MSDESLMSMTICSMDATKTSSTATDTSETGSTRSRIQTVLELLGVAQGEERRSLGAAPN